MQISRRHTSASLSVGRPMDREISWWWLSPQCPYFAIQPCGKSEEAVVMVHWLFIGCGEVGVYSESSVRRCRYDHHKMYHLDRRASRSVQLQKFSHVIF